MMDIETLTRICREAYSHWYGGEADVRADFVASNTPSVKFGRDYDDDRGYIIFHVSDYFSEMDEDEMERLADECVYARYRSNDHVRMVDEIKRYLLKDSFLEDQRPVYIGRLDLDSNPKKNSEDTLVDPNGSLKRLCDAGLLTPDEVKDIIVVWDPDLWANPIADDSVVMRTVKLSKKLLRESIPYNVRDYLVYVMVLRIIYGFKNDDALDDTVKWDADLLRRQHMFKNYDGVETYISERGADF